MWQKHIKYLDTAGLSPEAVAAILEFDRRRVEFDRREFELDGEAIEGGDPNQLSAAVMASVPCDSPIDRPRADRLKPV